MFPGQTEKHQTLLHPHQGEMSYRGFLELADPHQGLLWENAATLKKKLAEDICLFSQDYSGTSCGASQSPPRCLWEAHKQAPSSLAVFSMTSVVQCHIAPGHGVFMGTTSYY